MDLKIIVFNEGFMSFDAESLVVEFKEVRESYLSFCKTLTGLVDRLLLVNGIAVHSIGYRCKTVESFASKVDRKGSYKSLGDITDLAGIRIITLFSEDVDVVAQLIEKEFLIDRDNSIDKRAAIDPDRFGYLSLHYVASLNDFRSSLQEYAGFGGFKVEIQIRSILQHTWAEIEHDIGYKSVVEVPRHIRRRFSRLAGLLELADQEFIGIRNELDSYALQVEGQMKTGAQDILVDKITLSNYVGTNEVCMRLDDSIAKLRGVPLTEYAGFARNISSLESVGVNTIAMLDQCMREHESDVLRRAKDAALNATDTVNNIARGRAVFFLVQVMVASSKDREFIRDYVRSNKWSESFVEYLMDF